MSYSKVCVYVFALLLCGSFSYVAAADKSGERSILIDHAIPGYEDVPLQELYMLKETCGKVALQRMKAILAQDDLSNTPRNELMIVRAMLEENTYTQKPDREYSIGEQLCIGTPPAIGALFGTLLECNGQGSLASIACDTISKPGFLACWCLPVSLLLVEFLGHATEDDHTTRTSDLERVNKALMQKYAPTKEE